MNSQREFFKKIHPDQFSDSQIVKFGQLDRDFFSYFLETLTNEGREKDFEVFCRKLAEAEICPNLLPQTGPTGGGDSKVDTETYPVSETLASTWYYGYGNESATTRWAFAISAKKEWKPKVKSDVLKIVQVNSETRRGYTKIFFMTNQYVSDKKRAETEDEIRILHDIDVRILDKSWILDKVFNGNNKNIAIDCFHLSDSFRDEKQIGARDLERKRELAEIENRLKNPTKIKESENLALAMRSITLGRELELPRERMIGILERAQSLCQKYGTKMDKQEIIYQYAWTIFWWYQDSQLYYKKYLEYEKLALEDDNVHHLNNLTTLWINLSVISRDEPDLIPFKHHTDLLIEELHKYINNPSRPNASLVARASYQMVRTILMENSEDILNEFKKIILSSDGNLELNLNSLSKLIMDTPVYKNTPNYNDVFELLIEKLGKQSQDLTTAKMLNQRGIEVQDNQPYRAIQYFSRSLHKLFNEESKNDLIQTLILIAKSFEKVGLMWAARNFYMYSFYLSFNQYFKFGELNISLIISSNALKLLELKLGRILYATEFHFIETIARNLYPKNFTNEKANDMFDYILGIQMFRVEFSHLTQLEYFPNYLYERDLPFSSAALQYELGYYEEEILQQFNGDKEAFDDFVRKWYNQPAKAQFIEYPWFGFENKAILKSKILGCEMKVVSPNNPLCMEISATILASLESFFVTGLQNKLFPMAKSILLELEHINKQAFDIRLKMKEEKPNLIKITCSNYSKEDILDAQRKMQDFLLELLSCVLSILLPYDEAMENLGYMITNENALDRSQTFSNSTFYVLENLGSEMFRFSSLVPQNEKHELKRTEKVTIAGEAIESAKITQQDTDLKIHYGEPPQKLDFETTDHQSMSIDTVINVPLWNKSKWKGVAFLNFPNNDFPPIFSPVFLKNSGVQIFKQWKSDYGPMDSKNQIQIGIIKGINKKHPHWYRVIIGSDPTRDIISKDRFQLFSNIQRLHTMQAVTVENLNRFEISLRSFQEFIFLPSIMLEQHTDPEFIQEYAIRKSKESIHICNAYEIKENNFFLSSGIMPEDDPIIPKVIKNPYVLKLIEEKKRFKNK